MEQKNIFTGRVVKVDSQFIEKIEQNLLENQGLSALRRQLQESSVEFSGHVIESLRENELVLGEKLFHAGQLNAPSAAMQDAFLMWLQDFVFLLENHARTAKELQSLFGIPTAFRNRGLRGWDVEAAIATSCGGLSVAAGTHGILTGNVNIVPERVSLDVLQEFAYDCARVREVLMHPEGFSVTQNENTSYWDVISELTGDYFLAAHIALQVYWDGESDRAVKMLDRPSYVPWLKIA